MTDMDRKRAFVSGLYPAEGWKKKVAKMPDKQVVAIYLREQAKANETKPKKEDDGQDTFPF